MCAYGAYVENADVAATLSSEPGMNSGCRLVC